MTNPSDTPLTPPPATPLATPPTPRRAGPDGRLCMNCGYALDGLAVDGVCPECGTAVELSLRPNWLAFASPPWLRRLYRGFVEIEISVAFLIARSIFGGPAANLGVLAVPPIAVVWFGVGMTVLFSLIEAWGWWRVTSPEPSREGSDAESGSVRRWVRSLAVCGAVLRLFSSLVSALQLGPSPWVEIPGVVSSLVFAALILVAAKFLEGLAGRAPHSRLQRTIRLTWSLAWLILVEGLFQFVGVILVQLGVTGAASLFTCARIPFWFAWLAWVINYVRAIDGCREMMSRAVRRAEFLAANRSLLPGPSPAVDPDP